jgi:sugar lactone lactonase YvrE
MSKPYPQFRLLMRILAIAGFVVMFLLLAGYIFIRIRVPQLLEFSKGIEEVRVETTLDSLPNARFVEGMNGAENLWFMPGGSGFFVTCLDGQIHFVDRDGNGNFKIMRSIRPGTAITGICALSDSLMAVVICKHPREEWISKGGSVYLMPVTMDTLIRISEDMQAANGLCADSRGNLYLASCNFSFLHPKGNIYFLEKTKGGSYSAPVPLFEKVGLANGMFYDRNQDRIFFSNTIGGTYSFVPGERSYQPEYLKLSFMEACDDLCTDISGNLWMTDPGSGTVKIYNPGTNQLIRISVKGVGQTSTCRIRNENGHEIVYLTELKQENQTSQTTFDGKRVLIVPARELLGLLK